MLANIWKGYEVSLLIAMLFDLVVPYKQEKYNIFGALMSYISYNIMSLRRQSLMGLQVGVLGAP